MYDVSLIYFRFIGSKTHCKCLLYKLLAAMQTSQIHFKKIEKLSQKSLSLRNYQVWQAVTSFVIHCRHFFQLSKPNLKTPDGDITLPIFLSLLTPLPPPRALLT